MTDKIRIRTEQELQMQSKGLIEIKNILSKYTFFWMIDTGTLLGAARDNDFIKWDWDAGVMLFTEEVYPIKTQLIENFIINGFKLSEQTDFTKENLKLVFNKYGWDYELMAWKKKGKYRYRNSYKKPNKYFNEMNTIELRGVSYPCPKDLDDYLTYVYGDWKTPIRTADKETYLSNKNLRGVSLIRKLRRKIKLRSRIKRILYYKRNKE